MFFANLVFFVAAGYLLAWSVYLLALPTISRLRMLDQSSHRDASRSRNPHISVVIPAYNMEQCIERCVDSLLGSRYPGECVKVYVIADHCSDRTAAVARAAGAQVLIRDQEPAGKTFALDWAFRQLKDRGVASDLYIIVDATAYVTDDLVSVLAERWSCGENVIMAHTLVDPANQMWFARCLGLTLAHRNLQDTARERLSLSALVCGRAMAFGKEYVEKHGWSLALPSEPVSNAHPTEDFRHGVRLAAHGYRVAFAIDAYVFTPLRQSLGAATRQNVRWERGRIGNAYTHARELLFQAVRERRLRKLIAALDAIQPPVAVTIGLSVVLALLAVLLLDARTIVSISVLPLFLLFLYTMLVIRQGQREGIAPTALLWAPVYIAWRGSAFLAALTGLDRLLYRDTNRISRP